jgi:hypothetical protein
MDTGSPSFAMTIGDDEVVVGKKFQDFVPLLNTESKPGGWMRS